MSLCNTASKKKENIIITGDSISFNRYDYYADSLGFDAFCYGAGMPSWAFSLRDRLYFCDPQFIFGKDLEFNCKSVSGLDNNSSLPHTEMFGGRIQTLSPCGDVTFEAPIKGGEIVLYLQKRLDDSCTFDVWVDGRPALSNVDTTGNEGMFLGYEPLLLRLECKTDSDKHTVTFKNIRGKHPKITVCGAGAEYRNIVLNGKGSQKASFFIENFEDRIARHSPDLIIITLSANDRAYITPAEYERDTNELFSLIFGGFPECRVLFLLPPSSQNPDDPKSDILPFTSDETAEKYNLITEQAVEAFRKKGFDISSMRISSLFEGMAVSDWRFDNIHLNKNGNKILLEAVAKAINLI